MKNTTFRIMAGVIFVITAVLTVIEQTIVQTLMQGAFNLYTLLDLAGIVALLLLVVSAFIKKPVLTAVGGALIGCINLYNLIEELVRSFAKNAFQAELLLYYSFLAGAGVIIVLFAIKKKDDLMFGLLMPVFWMIANAIHMAFGYAGKFFTVLTHTKNYLPLIIPLLMVMALLSLALSAKKE